MNDEIAHPIRICVSILLLVVLSSCTITEEGKGPLKVGVLVSLTGQDAYFGDTIQKGIVLANKNRDVELIIEDFG